MPAKPSLSFALEPRSSLRLDDYVADLAWSADGMQIGVAGGEGKVGLVAAGAPEPSLEVIGEHVLGTLAIAWQPRAARFATAGQDGAVALWDAAAARAVKRWKPAVSATQALQYSPGGELLATA